MTSTSSSAERDSETSGAEAKERIGLIAGSGRLPFLFARAAREQGLEVVAVAHEAETDASLAQEVAALHWVKLGQLDKMARILSGAGVRRAVMAGGLGRVRALSAARPDLGALSVIARLRSFRDDALLRGVADFFERRGVEIVAPTSFLSQVLAPAGHLAGPALSEAQRRDVALGVEVAGALGRADVGQTVVVKLGHVLALEAVEGTDETIRRGGRLGGPGAVVVKRCKPAQDQRFDLPAVGSQTIAVMAEVGARVLAVEAGRSILIDASELLSLADQKGISLVSV